jgi:hypothetical protein
MESAAAVLGIQVHFADAQTDSDLNPAFERLVRLKVGALALSGDQFHFSRRDQIISLAARHKIPAIYSTRQFVMAGGMMSYGPNLANNATLIFLPFETKLMSLVGSLFKPKSRLEVENAPASLYSRRLFGFSRGAVAMSAMRE